MKWGKTIKEEMIEFAVPEILLSIAKRLALS